MSTPTSTSNNPTPTPTINFSNKRASHIRNLFVWETPQTVADAVVLITGAASGIAKQLAHIYAYRGCRLVLCDYNTKGLMQTLDECRALRKEQRPSQYATISSTTTTSNNTSLNATQLSEADYMANDPYVIGLHVDVTKQEMCQQFVDLAVERFGGIDVLLLVAGIGAHNVFSETQDLSMFRKCIDINYYGYLYCTHAAYPHLIKSRGVLTAITSFSGEVGLPYRTAYCASKFAVTGFLEALRAEMEDLGGENKFSIVIICPPTTNTNLRNNSLTSAESLKEKHQNNKAAEFNTGISVEDCASCIVDATDRRLRKAFFPFGSALASYARPLVPDYIDRKIWSKARL